MFSFNKKRLISCIALVCASSIHAQSCLSEFDNDYHQSLDVNMCEGMTKYFIAGLTDDLKQPVHDKVIIRNIVPSGATAYVSITPLTSLIIDGQTGNFTTPATEGQCIDLISTYPKQSGVQAFQLMLTAKDVHTNAVRAVFDYEVGSSC